MNVEPPIQAELLQLAAVDAELTRIAHRRTVLPEQQEVARLEAERNAHKDAAVAVEIVLDDLDRDIRKLEGEVEAVRKREDRDKGMLTAGSVNAKQLTEIQHELGSLERRRSVLEDELLEVMERREASAADHEHAGARLSKTDEDLAAAQRQRDEALADLDVAQGRCDTDRSGLVARFPAELLAIYDRQREQHGAARPCCRPAAAVRAASNSTAARSRGSPRPRATWSCAARSAARSWSGPRNRGCERAAVRLGRSREAGMTVTYSEVIVEADGGSRGNPGPAGYGAVVYDAEHVRVLAERREFIGVATNNVAEYRGLIAGLEAAAELGAESVTVRMDSKLVVEQMSGRWKVKHASMIPLADRARRLVAGFARVSFTWIPRERNAHADRLANEAMDDATLVDEVRSAASREQRAPATGPADPAVATDDERELPSWIDEVRDADAVSAKAAQPGPGWTGATGRPTRLLLLRHGQTELSLQRRYSGRGNPPLTALGREQAARAAKMLAAKGDIAAVVSSPLGRARRPPTPRPPRWACRSRCSTA